jgi:hypothetical protein
MEPLLGPAEAFKKLFADAVRERHTALLDAIEATCERMLTRPNDGSGMGGVLVLAEPGAEEFVVGLSRSVPWGEIHYRVKVS